jgi:capsular exopolysaccharide synthesis family protein
MEVVRYLRLVRRQWPLILACAGLAVAAAAFATWLTPPTYQSSITMFVSVAESTPDTSAAYEANRLSAERVKSYADLLNSRRLATEVAGALRDGRTAGQIQGEVSAQIVPDTVLLRAAVTDTRPHRAQRIAAELGTQFVRLVRDLEQPGGRSGALVKVTVVDQAELPTTPVGPDLLGNLALGLAAGLVLGIGAGALRESLDLTVKSVEQLAELTGGSALGVVGYDGDAVRRPLTVHGPAYAPRAEAFRFLRTNLQFVDIDEPVRSVVITSPLAQEGKSLTACNLAIALAQAGKRVALVDGDLRKPRLAHYLGIEGSAGLTTLLLGRAGLDDVLQEWGGLTLSVLPSGPIPPNPSELLGSQHMQRILADLRSRADVVVIDAPPLLPVADAAVLGQSCDGAVLVARHGKTSADQIKRAAGQLRAVDVRLLGSVLNMAPLSRDSEYRYSYATEPASTT